MFKRVIRGWNAAPGAPNGWDAELDGECGALPIRVLTDEDGRVRHCESAWEPTAAELELLNRGHSVILRVWDWQPPVSLYVDVQPKPDRTDLVKGLWALARQAGGEVTIRATTVAEMGNNDTLEIEPTADGLAIVIKAIKL